MLEVGHNYANTNSRFLTLKSKVGMLEEYGNYIATMTRKRKTSVLEEKNTQNYGNALLNG